MPFDKTNIFNRLLHVTCTLDVNFFNNQARCFKRSMNE